MDEYVFEGHAFHDAFSKGKSSGEIKISASSITFTANHDGPVTAKFSDKSITAVKNNHVSFPIEGVVAKLGGASQRLVFITHDAYPDWTLYTADRKLLKNPFLHQDDEVSGHLRKASLMRFFNWSVVAAVVAVILAIPVLFVFYMDLLTGLIAPAIPVSWEQELGSKVMAQYKFEHRILEDEQVAEQLMTITKPLFSAVASERYEFQVSISDDPALNAFALPGGYIVINTGLILAADNADEVLGVLGHEISHITEQHGIRNIIGSAGVFITAQALLGDASGLLAFVANAAPLLLNQSYSRGFEADADEKGFALLQTANINPAGMIGFFEKVLKKQQQQMAELDNDELRQGLQTAMVFLSTHPATEKRIKELSARLQGDQHYYRNLNEQFDVLKILVRKFVIQNDEEKGNNNESGN